MHKVYESRRRFLRHVVGAGALGVVPSILDLERWAAAAPATGEYAALVCVFLYGGNDGTGTVVPADGIAYTNYAKARGALAEPKATLLPITPTRAQPIPLGFNPNIRELHGLFGAGKLAVVANVGPLLAPTTRAQYLANSVPLPPNLFAHDEQQEQWQTSLPSSNFAKSGWGGRIADLMRSVNAGGRVSSSIAIDGSTNIFQMGSSVVQYQVPPWGIAQLDGYYDWRPYVATAAQQMFRQTRSNILDRAWNNKMTVSIDTAAQIKTALDGAPALRTVFADNYIASQLKMAARLISIRASLGVTRQVFFVAQGGYDTHGAQVTDHPNLLRQLSGALKSFYDATVEIGIANNVTAFTASDFGRTLIYNGEGTDHGWGNHSFVLGGSVKGGDVYGTYPTVEIDGPNDSGEGRWIPTIAVDQYAATLAKWFGVSASNMATVVPNIGRFASNDLGFLS